MTKKENESNLNYIAIDRYNKLKDLTEDSESQILMDLVNSISVEKEENVGKEINKLFVKILPENKEGDILKVNYALSKKIRESSELKSKEFKKQHDEYMTQIMNTKINQNFILTREINEKLAIVLSQIFKKIQKINKFHKYEELVQYIKEISENTQGVLEKYKVKNEIHNSEIIYNIYNEDVNNENENFSYNISSSRVSKVINYNNNEFKKSIVLDSSMNCSYLFKDLKTKKTINIPLEILILREKFENIKKLKLILKKNMNNNEILLLDQKDLLNNMFILLNLQWLFRFLFEIELDLTNEKILKEATRSRKMSSTTRSKFRNTRYDDKNKKKEASNIDEESNEGSSSDKK